MKFVPALLADWANGLFAVLTASWVLGIEPTWWHFILGALLSHFPDLDAIPEFLRRGVVSSSEEHPHDHRDGLHYPVILIALGSLSVFVDEYWGLIFLLNLVFHLVNDFYGTGWGIKLFWPITNRQYKFLGRRVNQLRFMLDEDKWRSISDEERKLRLVVSWSKEELPEYMQRWGVDNWVEEIYYKLNWISGVEYLLFFIAIACTLLSLL